MSNNDVRRAERFFEARLRNAKTSPTALRRWVRMKLRTDTDALAQLMMVEGYRPTFIRYFVKYHIPRLREALEAKDGQSWQINESVVTVLADIRDAARRLPQPYRDLAMVCLRWGYVLDKVIRMLAKELAEPEERNADE